MSQFLAALCPAAMTAPKPTQAAEDLWEHLVNWQPATAAALLQQLRALPDDWPLRVFGVGRPDAALALPPGAHGEAFDDQPPETAPYSDNEWEGCPACTEHGRNCRYHEGYATGRHQLYEPLLNALKADDTVTVRAFLQQLSDDAPAAPADVEHCVHDRAVHARRHHQPVTGCPWCTVTEERAAGTCCWCGHPEDRHWTGATHMTFPDGCHDCPGWNGAHAYGQELPWLPEGDGPVDDEQDGAQP